MPNLYVKKQIEGNAFTIGGGVAGGRVSWQVSGTRHDAFIEANPIRVEVSKSEGTEFVKVGESMYDIYPKGFPNPRAILKWFSLD